VLFVDFRFSEIANNILAHKELLMNKFTVFFMVCAVFFNAGCTKSVDVKIDEALVAVEKKKEEAAKQQKEDLEKFGQRILDKIKDEKKKQQEDAEKQQKALEKMIDKIIDKAQEPLKKQQEVLKKEQEGVKQQKDALEKAEKNILEKVRKEFEKKFEELEKNLKTMKEKKEVSKDKDKKGFPGVTPKEVSKDKDKKGFPGVTPKKEESSMEKGHMNSELMRVEFNKKLSNITVRLVREDKNDRRINSGTVGYSQRNNERIALFQRWFLHYQSLLSMERNSLGSASVEPPSKNSIPFPNSGRNLEIITPRSLAKK